MRWFWPFPILALVSLALWQTVTLPGPFVPFNSGAFTSSGKFCAHSGTTSTACTPQVISSNAVTKWAVGESVSCTVGVVSTSAVGITLSVEDTSNTLNFTAEGAIVHWSVGSPTVEYVQNFHYYNYGSYAATVITASESGVSGGFPGTTIMCSSVTTTGSGPSYDTGCNAGTSATGSTISCSSAMTTAKADWIFCGAFADAIPTAGTGFTLALFGTNSQDFGGEYAVQSSAGMITPSVHLASSTNGGLLCSAYSP